MVAVAFDHLAVGSYAEAVTNLAEYGDDAKILAGGQSLMPMLNLRLVRPAMLIDINAADDRQPSLTGDTLILPGLTRHRGLLTDPLVGQHCPLLPAAVWHIGNVRVRNRGTLGGSLAHADPTSELGACALALDARVAVSGPDGERVMPADDLFVSYLTTSLEEAEIITDVLIPAAQPGQGWSFHEMVRRTSDFAIVAAAAWLATQDGAVTAARVALAGVADRVVLAPAEVVAPLLGGAAGESEIAAVAAAIADWVEPGSDVHATAGYRQRLTGVLSARALREACRRAGGEAK